jgi:hypothetical protein
VIRRTGSCLAGAALALIALAPWPVLALLSAPSVDDFCLFALVRDPGWAAAQRQMYHDHSGRFVATALITGLGWLIDRLGAGLPGPFTLLPLLAIAAILWLCWRTLARLFPERPAAQRAIATAFSGALLLATLPGAGELLFWASGMASYLPLLLLLWHLMLRVADTLKGRRPPGGGETALLTALAFLVAGTHELGGPLILPLLAAWAEAGRRRGWRRSGFAWLAAIGAGALIACAIVLAAPGNGTRLSDYPGSGDLLRALPMGLVDTVIFLAMRVAAAPPLLGGLALAWLLAARRPSPPAPAAAAGWLLPATWLAVLLVTGIASRYAVDHALPRRGLDLLYALGVPALAFAATWHGRVRGAAILAGWSAARRRAAPVVAILLCLAGAGEWRAMWAAAVTGPGYRREYDARVALLAGAPAGARVAVPAFLHRSRLLLIDELSTDPGHWHNRCVADYFRLAAVARASRGP